MYVFNLFRAAKFVRSVRAHSVPDAVAMIPEFTNAKIHGNWTSAHQWFGLEALEIIIDIEATNAKPADTKSPADVEVTGGLMNHLAAIGQCEEPADKLTIAPLDAPEFIPLGASCQLGALLVLRDLC